MPTKLTRRNFVSMAISPTAPKEGAIKSKASSVIKGLLVAVIIPCFFYALKFFEDWSLEYLYFRGEVNLYGYGAI